MASPQKSKSTISVVSGRFDKMYTRSEEGHKGISSKQSASVIYRKQNIYNQGAFRPPSIPAASEVRQRVLSARRLKIKSYQNQLTEAKQTIEDLLHENRLLQTLHKRQDSALAKYESSNAELPQLLNAHSEELRIWQTKCKNMQQVNKELEHKIKQKESIILSLTDQNKYYSQLNKDKHLLERQQLREENETLLNELKEKDAQMKNLKKRTELEMKNLKLQLQHEQKKSRNALVEIEKYRLELHTFNKLEQLNIPNIDSKRPKCHTKESTKVDSHKNIESSGDAKRFDSLKKETNFRNSKSHVAGCTDRGDGDATVTNVAKRSQKSKRPPNMAKQNNPEEVYKFNSDQVLADQPLETNLEQFKCSQNVEKNEIFESFRSDNFSETDFNTKRMRTDITNIRNKLLGDDYERREEFIDGFCLQQSMNGAIEDENEEIYRNYTKDNLQIRPTMKN